MLFSELEIDNRDQESTTLRGEGIEIDIRFQEATNLVWNFVENATEQGYAGVHPIAESLENAGADKSDMITIALDLIRLAISNEEEDNIEVVDGIIDRIVDQIEQNNKMPNELYEA